MIPAELGQAREKFLELVAELRPELHRYCARLTGSVIDGEDVVQDTLAKAYYAISMATEMPPLRPFLFRIAHNTALDVLRRYERRNVERTADIAEDAVVDERADPEVVRAALGSFLELPVAQRSAVILKDVLGCTLEEIVESTGATLPAVKAALSRGRAGIRAKSDAKPQNDAGAGAGRSEKTAMDPAERAKLHHYASLFNERDWEGLRALIAEDARLDLVSRAERRGAGVGEYFSRYAGLRDLRVVPGTLDGRPALAMYSPRHAPHPTNFVLVEWRAQKVTLIRDFRYVSYIADEVVLDRATFVPDDGEAP